MATRPMMIGSMAGPKVVDGLDELLDAGRRLRALDPERFMRVLYLCRAYVAIYERVEPLVVSVSRLRRVTGVKADA
jgi:hypothetical protein